MGGRQALGRGLSALIPQAGKTESDKDLQMIPLSQIRANRRQPRKEFSEEQLLELADSLKEHGILEPLVVRPVTDGEKSYELVVGERRWRAAKLAGLAEVPCLIREMDERQALELALVENLQREDLNALEEAEAYKQLAEEYQLTQEEIAGRVGKKRATITNRLRLLELEDEIKELVRSGGLSAGHAKALLSMPPGELRKKVAAQCLKEGWSVRQIEAFVQNRLKKKPQAKKATTSEAENTFSELEQDFQRVLGTRVRIMKQGKKGHIQIEFYDDEDITRIYELIVGNEESIG
ncbi:MAG TPA: ParB/RepB/Spo0J family partition protein [Firmicutes bacterium]|nr:ParB/RepB/Spo0J family partition protein [Bacillota bacterium]